MSGVLRADMCRIVLISARSRANLFLYATLNQCGCSFFIWIPLRKQMRSFPNIIAFEIQCIVALRFSITTQAFYCSVNSLQYLGSSRGNSRNVSNDTSSTARNTLTANVKQMDSDCWNVPAQISTVVLTFLAMSWNTLLQHLLVKAVNGATGDNLQAFFNWKMERHKTLDIFPSNWLLIMN